MISRCLALHLKNSSDIITWSTRKEMEELNYPAPNVTLNESDGEKNANVGIEWGILKMLSLPGWCSSGSEPEPERHIGCSLASFFRIDGCNTASCVCYS